VVVCLLGAFVLFAVFSQLRFSSEDVFRAEFSDVSGLKDGDFVRIAGVEVGKVKAISITRDGRAMVEFTTDPTVILTGGTKAVLRWADPLGNRYLALLDGGGTPNRLAPGGTIPLDHTEPALDIDTLLGGFRPLFRALDPQQVNALSGQLIQAFQEQGPAIGSFLLQAATVTNTLADRDALIGEVITNLNTVLGTLGDGSKQLDKAVESLSHLVAGLAEHKEGISNAIAYTNRSSATVADLLTQARPPFANTIAQTDRTAGIFVADHEYVENLLDTLPETYRLLARQGIYGDYFSFYICDVMLKMNGKGGQPVYVKVAGQDTGRCAPK
jgi:phospholipid/cholesterol/gamma-HCH transport system substrate-binding protein